MNSKSEIINRIMFDFLEFSEKEIISMCEELSNKKLRWLGANHMDNKIRKIFYRLTNVKIGENTVINQNFIVSDDYEALLHIGDRVAISPNVTVICASAPNNSALNELLYVKENLICSKKVIIGDDVWLGVGCVILPGVVIGEKSIIGAGAVVNKYVEPFSIYSGVPAKFIKRIGSNEV